MTLSRFIKELQRLEDKGHGRAKVTVNVDEFSTGNGTWQICDVKAVEHDWIRQVDDDGFTEFNKDGSERTKSCIVLKG